MDRFEKVYHRDGYRCVYCGKYMLADFDTWQSIHTDHLIPNSREGSAKVDNLVTSCPVCNILKGEYVPTKSIDEIGRKAYLQDIRDYIHKRRSERMNRFFRLIDQMNARLNDPHDLSWHGA